MRSFRIICSSVLAVAGFVFTFWYLSYTPVKASSDCPVQSATPNADGSTTVVFDCGAYIIAIQEPQWSQSN